MINQITQENLAKHAAWLRGKPDGVRVVTVSNADLRNADLRDADLRNADLRDANLRGANLRNADLRDADLRNADLRDANLRGANLSGADLHDADLRGANLSGADLRDADLSGAKNVPDYVTAITSIVSEGDLVVYKQLQHGDIATLKIPARQPGGQTQPAGSAVLSMRKCWLFKIWTGTQKNAALAGMTSGLFTASARQYIRTSGVKTAGRNARAASTST